MVFKFFVALSLLALPLAAEIKAAEKEPVVVVDLWPTDKMPESGAREAEKELPAKGDGVRRITNVSRPTLTVFPAKIDKSTDKAAPAFVVCPGGGYGYVVYDKEGTEIAAWLNANGITALVLKYRTPNNRAGAFTDVQRALRMARAHATEWNVDAARLGVMGFSAGGHLSARASTNFEPAAYAPVDDVDKLSCRPDYAVLVYPAYLGRDEKVAPELNITAKIPPTLIVHNEDDNAFIAGSKIYSAALKAAKAPHEFLLYSTGGHGYGLRGTREARVWPQDTLQWLQKIGVVTAAVEPAKQP